MSVARVARTGQSTVKYWTHPLAEVPNRVLVEVTWRGGHRHGEPPTAGQIAFDAFWRKRVTEIVRDPLEQDLFDRSEDATLAL